MDESDPRNERRTLGLRAEQAAADYFLTEGLVIVGRNVRVGRLEIDLLVRDGPVIAVVEVRFRGAGSWVRPLTSVDARKRVRVRRAGEKLWQLRFKKDPTLERMRFDLVSVRFGERGEPAVEHVRAAF